MEGTGGSLVNLGHAVKQRGGQSSEGGKESRKWQRLEEKGNKLLQYTAGGKAGKQEVSPRFEKKQTNSMQKIN